MQLSRVGCVSSCSSLKEFKGFLRVASIKEDACRSSRNFDTQSVDFKQSWQLSSSWCCRGPFPSGRVFNATCRQGKAGKRFLPFVCMRSNNRRTEPTMVARTSLQSQPWEPDDEALLADSPPYLLQTDDDDAENGKLASAMGLIMGTAVGPGILGLPAATLQAGLIPSTLTILAAWAYVMGSILLVAELSYGVMAEQGGEEVSFTGLAVRTLGNTTGRVVAVVYALLNYALLVACVAGLHSILACWLPLPPAIVCILSPAVVVSMLAFTSFEAVDGLNRALCGLMLAAIAILVGIGIYFGRNLSLASSSVSYAIWAPSASLRALPVIVLTLGFHVITPLVCKVVGGKPRAARKAILCGGAVPLAMVLAWNAVILSLHSSSGASSLKSIDPIKLLLSMSSMAAPAVQAFAFSALGTTLIGYALSFPKQLIDTSALFLKSSQEKHSNSSLQKKVEEEVEENKSYSTRMLALGLAVGPPVAMAMTSPTAFASALNFAGVYANCFLFGVLPPIMAWVYRYRIPEIGNRASQNSSPPPPPTTTTTLVPGGRMLLMLLLLVALFLGLKPPSPR